MDFSRNVNVYKDRCISKSIGHVEYISDNTNNNNLPDYIPSKFYLIETIVSKRII